MLYEIVRAGQRTFFASASLLCMAVGGSSATYSKGSDMMYHVSCVVSGKAEAGMQTLVCDEMTTALALAYPQHSFTSDPAVQSLLNVAIVLSSASQHGVGMKLVWTRADGSTSEGPNLAFSIADKAATQAMRSSLYRRVIASAPLPE